MYGLSSWSTHKKYVQEQKEWMYLLYNIYKYVQEEQECMYLLNKLYKYVQEEQECMFLLYNLYINLACLSVCLFVCLSVCLYPINVKTAEPIGPKFFVGHHATTGKVYEWSKFQIFVSIKIRSSFNFLKFWKSTKFFGKIRELFLFCFTMYTKRTCSQLI